MNQHIVGSTKHSTGHAEGKADFETGPKLSIEFKEHATGGDISSESGEVALTGRQEDRQRKWKAHRTANFLPRGKRLGEHCGS
jgi:hypothetical protein